MSGFNEVDRALVLRMYDGVLSSHDRTFQLNCLKKKNRQSRADVCYYSCVRLNFSLVGA